MFKWSKIISPAYENKKRTRYKTDKVLQYIFSIFVQQTLNVIKYQAPGAIFIATPGNLCFSSCNAAKKMAFAVTPFERTMILESFSSEEVKKTFLEVDTATQGKIDVKELA